MGFPERLNIFLKSTGIRKNDLPAKIGVGRGMMFNYLAGRNEPPASFFQSLKAAFPGINLEWLLTGIGEMEAPAVAESGSEYQKSPTAGDRFSRTILLMLSDMTDEQKAKVQQYAEDQKRLAELESIESGGGKKTRGKN